MSIYGPPSTAASLDRSHIRRPSFLCSIHINTAANILLYVCKQHEHYLYIWHSYSYSSTA